MNNKRDKIKDAGYEKHYVYNAHYHLIWCTKYRNQIFTNQDL
ncbi:transposase, partial [Lactobacillus amylovorus]